MTQTQTLTYRSGIARTATEETFRRAGLNALNNQTVRTTGTPNRKNGTPSTTIVGGRIVRDGESAPNLEGRTDRSYHHRPLRNAAANQRPMAGISGPIGSQPNQDLFSTVPGQGTHQKAGASNPMQCFVKYCLFGFMWQKPQGH